MDGQPHNRCYLFWGSAIPCSQLRFSSGSAGRRWFTSTSASTRLHFHFIACQYYLYSRELFIGKLSNCLYTVHGRLCWTDVARFQHVAGALSFDNSHHRSADRRTFGEWIAPCHFTVSANPGSFVKGLALLYGAESTGDYSSRSIQNYWLGFSCLPLDGNDR